MKSYKQLFTGVAGFALLLSAFTVQAADEAGSDEFASKITSGENVVLFKVHDIETVKDENGVVTDCEFGITLYNRSPKSVDAATINLTWIDEGVANVIDMEENMAVEDALNHNSKEIVSLRQENALTKTGDFVEKSLSATIVLPQIKPFRQVSLKSKIKSDRCFLMIENANFNFSSCNVTEPTTGQSKRLTASRSSGDTDCKSLFRFVSPRDPEYYREFQKVSFNEEQKRKEEAKKKDIEELENTYNKMLKDVNHITEVLGTPE